MISPLRQFCAASVSTYAVAEAGDGAPEHCLGARALADLTCDLRSQSVGGLPAHQPQGRFDLLVGNEVEERRLAELDARAPR